MEFSCENARRELKKPVEGGPNGKSVGSASEPPGECSETVLSLNGGGGRFVEFSCENARRELKKRGRRRA